MGQYSDLGGCLEEQGLESIKDPDNWLYDNDAVGLTADDFFSLWLAMLNIGIDLDYDSSVGPRRLAYHVKAVTGKHHTIGGYGCYSC